MTDDIALSRELTSLIATAPGVVDVYASGPLPHAVTLEIINAAVDDDAGEAKVAVTRSTSGVMTITATIAIDDANPIPATLRSLSDVLRHHLETHHHEDRTPIIDLKISRVEVVEESRQTAEAVSGDAPAQAG